MYVWKHLDRIGGGWGVIFLKLKNNITTRVKFHPDFYCKLAYNFNSKQKHYKDDIHKIIKQC